jgi:hypothetical protein
MAKDFYDWGYMEMYLYEDMGNGLPSSFQNDRMVQALYDTALFNYDISKEDRNAVMGSLKDYMWDEYGVDFDDVFDWENYREAYDNAQV